MPPQGSPRRRDLQGPQEENWRCTKASCAPSCTSAHQSAELLHGQLCCPPSPSRRVISCLCTYLNLARTLVLICSMTCRAARSLDLVSPGVVPTAAPIVPPAASNISTTPLIRKRAADTPTLKAERAKRQKAIADARQVQPNTPPPSSADVDASPPIPTAEPLLIDPSGVAHSDVPITDLDDERHTPPVASPARVTVAIPAPAARSADPAATATDQVASVVSPVTI